MLEKLITVDTTADRGQDANLAAVNFSIMPRSYRAVSSMYAYFKRNVASNMAILEHWEQTRAAAPFYNASIKDDTFHEVSQTDETPEYNHENGEDFWARNTLWPATTNSWQCFWKTTFTQQTIYPMLVLSPIRSQLPFVSTFSIRLDLGCALSVSCKNLFISPVFWGKRLCQSIPKQRNYYPFAFVSFTNKDVHQN